jgi:hypothetical protein
MQSKVAVNPDAHLRSCIPWDRRLPCLVSRHANQWGAAHGWLDAATRKRVHLGESGSGHGYLVDAG